MAKDSLSFVMPVYNEEEIIESTLLEVYKYFKTKNYKWEIIVVDDGSNDSTVKKFNAFKKSKKLSSAKLKLIKVSPNRGKGNAVKVGMLEARGDFIIFSDADLSTPLVTIPKMLAKYKKGYNVVIGSRRIKGATLTKRQPKTRELLGKGYTFMTQTVTGVAISDFTCGFKGFSKVAAQEVFKRSVVARWGYDAEIIFLAKKHGYEIVEVPVEWRDREASRVKLFSDLPKSLVDTLAIRWRDMRGMYA